MGNLEIGVILPGVAVQRREGITPAAAARHVEDVGLDGVWHGDHLAIGAPTLDAPIVLATAATATSRIRIGTSVFVPAIRPLAWAAKQIATLQYVSGDRLVLGVGSGGGAGQWAAAGVTYAQRGRRTDTALELLPRLLAGEPTRLPYEQASAATLPEESGEPVELTPAVEHGEPVELTPAVERGEPVELPPAIERGEPVELTPAVTMPPVWVGNASPAAIRRAARLGDGWFPSLISPREVAEGRARLAELAAEHGRPTPLIAIGGTSALGDGPGLPSREALASGIGSAYGRPLQDVIDIPLTGRPEAAAERLAEYREAGATHAIIGISGGDDWRAQVDLLAETRTLLN
ncbi:LLM class flavin-dependent oxidoreductase [Nonomuraea antimicrobica]|uniref:LLM class flavin-dependent oxidoreductase n=1 Tax=Nonomuraea antimicrobica TaxID=561173 RepID=UPI0031E8A350